MPQPRTPAADVKVISGYILPERHVVKTDQDNASEGEEDEEEERQPEFLDMKEMASVSSGGQMFDFFVPSSKEGNVNASQTNTLLSFVVVSFCEQH